MSKIKNAFKNGKAFIGFLTAGDPDMSKTEDFILQMVKAGADLIEIGIPFSDPIAEGTVIQSANVRALKSNATTDSIFEMTESVRQKTDIPIVFLTYLNPVFKYGFDNFFKKCKLTGIDGLIVPDMPYEENAECVDIADKYDIDIISMIAPTSEDRIKKIAKDAKGFLYIISSMGVTGVRSKITTDLNLILKTVKSVTDIPAAIGFGINTPEQAKELSKISDGIIVGSAIVKIIEKHKNEAGKYIFEYVKSMKKAIV